MPQRQHLIRGNSVIRSASLFILFTFSFSAPAESQAVLEDKTQSLHHLKIGQCRFEVVRQETLPASVKVKVWINNKPSRIFYSFEGSGEAYTSVEAKFSFERASWESASGISGLGKLTLYSTYATRTGTSGFNRKWLEAWYGPKGEIVYVRLTSKRNGPTLLGLVTPTSERIDCKD